MPNISTINGTDITLLSNFQGVALTSGSLINGQTASLVNPTYDEIYSVSLGSLGASSLTINNTVLTTDYKTYDIFVSEIGNQQFRIYTANYGMVYWSNTDTAFNSYSGTGYIASQSAYYNNSWGHSSGRITLYDPANSNNDSRFDAEFHQAFPSGIGTASYIKIANGRLSSSNAATGISFSSTSTFSSGYITVHGIA